MGSGTSKQRDWLWFYAIAGGLFIVSLSRGFEELTSPHQFWSHVLLRKLYSVVAFSIVGYLGARATRAQNAYDVLRSAYTVGIYSAGIEIVQRVLGSHEGRLWNVADTLMGALGGFVGSSLYLLVEQIRRTRSERRALRTSRPITLGRE